MVYGGAIANPITALSNIISSLHDDDNHIIVPGFYDHVIKLSDTELALLSRAPFDEKGLKKHYGIKEFVGEINYSVFERTCIRPTVEINGIWGGYADAGIRSIIPSKAGAKISARLVPDQSSVDITEKLINYIKSKTPVFGGLSDKNVFRKRTILNRRG